VTKKQSFNEAMKVIVESYGFVPVKDSRIKDVKLKRKTLRYNPDFFRNKDLGVITAFLDQKYLHSLWS